jgi:alpha-tubulin suppressor-like RCC1 family protein
MFERTSLLRAAPLALLGLVGACSVQGTDGESEANALPLSEIGRGRIAAGLFHSCAVATTGRLSCWGDNRGGQLGNGTTNRSAVPVAAGADADWDSVTAGGFFTCGLKKGSGKRFCWGNNGIGQLGNGGINDSTRPLSAGDDGWAQLSAGATHGCGVKTDGTLLCWGDDSQGQIASPNAGGSNARSLLPREVIPQTHWENVSAGTNETCAVKSDHTLWCWGGYHGGNDRPRAPVQVGADADWARVDAGDFFTCGVKTSGALFCLGRNYYGEGGHSASGEYDAPPVQVGTATDWAVVRAGGGHVCALKTDASLHCWGYNYDGQAGVPVTPSTLSLSTPTPVAPQTSFRDVETGGSQISDYSTAHSCGMRADGSVVCWGKGEAGQLGDGETTQNSATPRQLGTDTDWASIGDGAWGTKRDGSLWQWGRIGTLYVGMAGAQLYMPMRQPVPARLDGAARSLGRGPACYVATDGRLLCSTWCKDLPPLGVVPCTADFAAVGTDTDWATVTSGNPNYTTCALKTSGALYCWGSNAQGVVGDGTTENRAMPTLVTTGAPAWRAVAMGSEHACAVGTDGTLWCWGDNFYGQLGDTPSTNHNTPAQVGADRDWADVTAGYSHSCALKTDGSLWCFGQADSAGIEDSERPVPTPTRVGGPTATYRSVSAQYLSTCAVAVSGTAWCWGFGSDGQLGDGRSVDSAVPVRVAGDFTDWVAVGRSQFYSCGVRADGTAWCWGKNDEGQLGLPVAWKDSFVDVHLP